MLDTKWKWTFDQCKTEQAFILKTNPVKPGAAFSYSRKTYARYCNMQANYIRFSGFPLIAVDILQARDIADPDYRLDHAKLGCEVLGSYCFENGTYNQLREEIRSNINR